MNEPARRLEPVDTDQLHRTKAEAPNASAHYMRAAVAEIDAVFGNGYAREHPELVASMIQASAIDAAVNAGREAHAEALVAADRISREMGETILKLKPRIFG